MSGYTWTPEEDKFLEDNLLTETNETLALLTGRTLDGVRWRLRVLGLKRRNCWTTHDDGLLKAFYLDKTDVELGALLGRTPSAIRNRLRRLKLRGVCHPIVSRENPQVRVYHAPDNLHAGHVLNYAKEVGKIQEGVCIKCGSKVDVQAHHEDYNKPLDVVWLCRRHHRELHNQNFELM